LTVRADSFAIAILRAARFKADGKVYR